MLLWTRWCSDHVGEERAGGLQVAALQAGEHLTQTLHPQSPQMLLRTAPPSQDGLSARNLIGQDRETDHFLPKSQSNHVLSIKQQSI